MNGNPNYNKGMLYTLMKQTLTNEDLRYYQKLWIGK
jgi:hypothetical protein